MGLIYSILYENMEDFKKEISSTDKASENDANNSSDAKAANDITDMGDISDMGDMNMNNMHITDPAHCPNVKNVKNDITNKDEMSEEINIDKEENKDDLEFSKDEVQDDKSDDIFIIFGDDIMTYTKTLEKAIEYVDAVISIKLKGYNKDKLVIDVTPSEYAKQLPVEYFITISETYSNFFFSYNSLICSYAIVRAYCM